ncbi:MAG: M20/M25/M40 family metallo-hydrolase [Phycisphaerales bacterium]|nr:M20/M25/M40 family metallo-hydrolase [Phycisphaerales bacterium]
MGRAFDVKNRSCRACPAVILLSVLSVVGCAGRPNRVNPEQYATHIKVLASDELAGRGIGTPGIDLAAGYIAGQFASIGIEPAGDNGTYFQKFEATTGSRLTDAYEFSLTGGDVVPERAVNYAPFSFSNNDAFDGDVVFAGYGLVDAERKHDDYKDSDVAGKIVLVLRRAPASWGDDGGGFNRAGSFQSKVYTAKEKKAAAVLVVDRQEDDNKLMPFDGRSGRGYGLPAFHVTRELADAMLLAGGLGTLAELQATADKGESVSKPLPGVHLKGVAGVEPVKVDIRNVVGMIRGEGPHADEYVVIGAHYDHLGFTEPQFMFGPRRPEGGEPPKPEIHNGADDNASGTAGVIEAGRVLTARRPLKRSVLLLAFTGEESGLWGSKHFVEHSPVPPDQMVAMLNMDMIGRLDGEKQVLQVFGTKAADEFETMIPRLVDDAKMKLRADPSALGPSDHTSFYTKKIPSVHFFTGLHQDYHKPGDDTDKVNASGGARVTDVVVAMADEIIRADGRPTYHEVKERADLFGSTDQSSGSPGGRSFRVVMGIMPGYASGGDVPGMAIDGVAPGGPAEKAGLKGEDRIIRMGTSTVNNIEDYMAALRNAKPGDVVDVVVNRDGKEMTLPVTLSGR